MARLHSYDDSSLSFHNIDERAKRASPADASSFDSLIKYMRKAIPDGTNRDLFMARGLIVWITKANTTDLSNAVYNTPLGLVQQMKNKRLTPADVFKIFCGYADIECTVIEGRCKAIRYKAGDGDSRYIQGHAWNAFKANGKWHLLHPQWSVQAIIGYVHGGEIKVESDGKSEVAKQIHEDGSTLFVFNDFWFCTNPEIFVSRCYPNDPTNQFLPETKRIRNACEFLALPDLRQGFYTHNLSLLNDKSCVLSSKKGKCTIALLSERKTTMQSEFSYELTLLGDDAHGLISKDLPLLVLNSRNKDVFSFVVRFPVIGSYRLKLRVGDVGQEVKPNCCEFLINCTETDPKCKKLPIDAGIAGWGYGPEAKEAGLMKPSEEKATKWVKPTETKDKKQKEEIMSFKVDEDMVDGRSYEAVVCGSDSLDDDQIRVSLIDCAETTVNKATGTLKINAHIENEGEYALVVKAKDKRDKGLAKPVANYLLNVCKKQDDDDKENDRLIEKRKKEAKTKTKKIKKMEQKENLVDSLKQLQIDIENILTSASK